MTQASEEPDRARSGDEALPRLRKAPAPGMALCRLAGSRHARAEHDAT